MFGSMRFAGRLCRVVVVCAALCGAAASIALAADDPLVVRTAGGLVRGIPRAGGGARFLGIPYAQPPVGSLRWREPLPAAPWPGVRDASAFGAPCAQPVLGDWNKADADRSKEDCLYLNVITPAWPAGHPLPVMFWIHGGGNEGGAGIGDLYNAGTLADHGVIVVTIGYRLGIFGFFAHPALSAESPHHASGNYGLMDQMLGLRWVRANIAAFGGDPSNITVFGQSAGAWDTGMLMVSPARGLFQKAIAESGAPFSPAPLPLAEAEQNGATLVTGMEPATHQSTIAGLRTVPAAELLQAEAAVDEQQHRQRRASPVVDGYVLPELPAAAFAAGRQAQVPLLLGTTTREFGGGGTVEKLREAIRAAAGDFAPQALAAYELDNGRQGIEDPRYGDPGNQWAADVLFRCPATAEAAWQTAAHQPVYQYEFDHPVPGHEAEGATHSAELPYVFGYFPKSGNIGGVFTAVDTKLAETMQTYWTNFAKTGDPNSANVPRWPRFGATRSYIQFQPDGSVAVRADLRGAQCAVYRQFLAAEIKAAR